MKRPVASVLTLGLVLGFCHVAAADEAEDFLKYYSWWEGTWEVETGFRDVVQTAEMVIERHEPGCHLVKGGGISVWGYDPESKRWVGTGFDSDGSRFSTVLDRPEGTEIQPGIVDKSQGEAWQPDGTKVLTESTWTYVDANTAELKRTGKTEGGEAVPEVVTTCRRKERR